MLNRSDVIVCDGCGVEITWSPVMDNDRRFCCEDCRDGRPCNCGTRMEEDDERRDNLSAIFDSGGPL